MIACQIDIMYIKCQYVQMQGTASPQDPAAPGSSRDRILDSAVDCFTRYGFHKTTFGEVASGAGVSRSLIYNYFNSKLVLLQAVREEAFQEWADAVEREKARCDTATDALQAYITETLRLAGEHPILSAFLSEDSRVALRSQPQSGALSRDAWRAQIAELLDWGVNSGEFRKDMNTAVAADALCAMQLGIISRLNDQRDPLRFDPLPYVVDACHIMLQGVVRQPTGARGKPRGNKKGEK